MPKIDPEDGSLSLKKADDNGVKDFSAFDGLVDEVEDIEDGGKDLMVGSAAAGHHEYKVD